MDYYRQGEGVMVLVGFTSLRFKVFSCYLTLIVRHSFFLVEQKRHETLYLLNYKAIYTQEAYKKPLMRSVN